MTPDDSWNSVDSRVARAIEEYLKARDAGEVPNHDSFLAHHHDIAGPLEQALRGLGRFVSAVPRLAGVGGELVTEQFSPTQPLGDYRILREVGRGGMGVVYEAEQLSLGRRVALKMLPFAAGLDSANLKRFKLEAQLAACLHHAHIVPIHGVGCERGVHFYVMQFIEGRSLAELLRERRGEAVSATADTARVEVTWAGLSKTKADSHRLVAQLGVQAAEALDYAHGQGVVHRDVKPANLLIDTHGQVWIADFGLAFQPAGDGLSLSRTGEVIGTLRYAAPEQARGHRHEIDGRADVYSLGVTLYELLTLVPPFADPDRQELLRRILHEEPAPPRRHEPTIPADLETICLKAMAKEAGERYATAGDLASDLRRFLEDRPVQARRPTPWHRLRKWARRHRRQLVAAVVTLVLGVVSTLAATTGLVWRAYQDQSAQRQQAEDHAAVAMSAVDVLDRYADQGLFHAPGREKEQRRFLRATVELMRPLADAPGAGAEARARATRAYWRLGALEMREHQWTAAVQSFEEALARGDALVSDFPEKRTFRADRANYRRQLAHALLGRLGPEDSEKAEALSHQALEEMEDLARPPFDNETPLRDWLFDARLDVAERLRARGRPEEAALHQQRGLEMALRLVKLFPDSPLSYVRTCYCQKDLALILQQAGRGDDAEREMRGALRADEHLARHFRDSPAIREATRGTVGILGRLLLDRGKFDEARECLTRAVAELEAGRKEFPGVPGYRWGVAEGLNSLGKLHYLAGRRADAAEAFRRAFAETIDLTGRSGEYARVVEFLGSCPLGELRDVRRMRNLIAGVREKSPDYPTLPRAEGLTHLRAGDPRAAIEPLRLAVRTSLPWERWRPLYLLARAHAGLGEADEARRCRDEAERVAREQKVEDVDLRLLREEKD